MSNGFVLWFTGLSGSGKSTLTTLVAAELRRRGVHVETLDGDEIRRHLSKGLGFSREDRDENIRRIGFVAKLVARGGSCAIAAAISPYRDVRNEVRRSCERFVEVYTECPIAVLAERDPKGLYKKALAGEIRNFTGVDDPYEAPEAPEVQVHTDRETPEESLGKILGKLEELGLIPRWGKLLQAGDEGRAVLLPPHGRELVDGWVHGAGASTARDEAEALPALDVDAVTLVEMLHLVSGAYSPLDGFMTSKDFLRVSRELRLESGLPWAEPVTLRVPAPLLSGARNHGSLALQAPGGRLVGIVQTEELWQRNGDADAGTAIGGRVRAFDPDLVKETLSALNAGAARWAGPADVRARMAELGWRKVVAVQTAGLPLVPDEYIVRAALEFADGVLVLPTAAPGDQVPLEVRMRAWEAVLAAYLPARRAIVAAALRVAGRDARRTAIHDAIVAKNYGATAMLALDAAGADREALASVFDCYVPGEIGIEILPASPRVSSARIGIATVHTCPDGGIRIEVGEFADAIRAGAGAATQAIRADAGTIVEAIRAGKSDPKLVRPEVAGVVAEWAGAGRPSGT